MIEILVPTSWEDVTVATYQKLKEIKAEDFETPLQHTNAVMKCLCNMDDLDFLTVESFNEVAKEIAFIQHPITEDIVEEINIRGEVYKWNGNLNQIAVGEMLSIEQIIDLEDLSYTGSIDVVLAVLLRKEGEDFDSSVFTERRELFNELPITEVNGMLSFFLRGGQIYIERSRHYSVVLSRTATNTPTKKLSWKRLLKRLRK